MNQVPGRMFFTRGVGVHKDRLASFELALRDAGIEKCNLVYVSSIFPPNCRSTYNHKARVNLALSENRWLDLIKLSSKPNPA